MKIGIDCITEGPKFSPTTVRKTLNKAGVKFIKPKSIEKTTAEVVAAGKDCLV